MSTQDVANVLTGWYDNLTGNSATGIVAPAWKIAAVQSLRNASYTQVKPYSIGGNEEWAVDMLHPTFPFLSNTDKIPIYKNWLIENGYFAQVGTNPLTDVLDNILKEAGKITQNSTPQALSGFAVALIGVVTLYFVFRKKK